jgi:hypothetical protein
MPSLLTRIQPLGHPMDIPFSKKDTLPVIEHGWEIPDPNEHLYEYVYKYIYLFIYL